MFKKEITPSPPKKVKSSVQRALRSELLETYPLLASYIDELLPKKASLEQVKIGDHRQQYLYSLEDGTPLFYSTSPSSSRNNNNNNKSVLLPHLKLTHRFPHAFPSVRVDAGAIRFVLSGATLMAPGLTSRGGRLPLSRSQNEQETEGEGEEGREEGVDEDGHWSRELEKGEPVVVMCERKEHAVAVGTLSMGTAECKKTKKGPIMEDAHYLGDGLWKLAFV